MAEVAELGAWQIAFWYTTACVLVAAGWVTFGGQHRRQIADRQIAWLLWHWFTGGTLETSRTFPGLDDDGTLAARAARRGAFACARTCAALCAGAVWYWHAGAARGTDPGTVAYMGACAAAVFALGTLAVAWAACRTAHFLCWERPLWIAVHDLLGWDQKVWLRRVMTIPRDRENAEDGVIIGLPPRFDLKPQRCEAVANVVRRKLDLGDVVETWVVAGRHSYYQARPRDPMPATCYYRDDGVKALVAKATSSAKVIGVKRGFKPVTCDLDSESPHVLLSAGTGGGKSAVLRAITAQLMADGARVGVIDLKRHSHSWLRGFPDEIVQYARDIEDIHNLLVRMALEGERRNRAWDDVGIDEAGPTFPRLVLLCEEMTATTGKLNRWWKATREPGDPHTSPAVEALMDIACMGRQVRIHLLAIAQMATAKSIGGSEIRENFAIRILGRYTKRAWEMLVPECEYTPASREAGRMQVCIGGVATETQMLFMTDKEARELAGGATAPQRHSITVHQGTQPMAVADAPPAIEDAAPGQSLISLTEAIEAGLIGPSIAAVRSSRARDPEFPAAVETDGQTHLYAVDHLTEWVRKRPWATTMTDTREPGI